MRGKSVQYLLKSFLYSIGVPTLLNSPANEWKNETDKINHLGDLYYDRETGFAYRFTNDEDVFSWVKLKDSDITEALALANSAQDTADSKRRVFIEEPIPPYDVGDIWIKEDKDLYRCRAKRIEGSFDGVDWCLATNYSNDDYAKDVEAILNQFKETVESDYVTTVLLEKTKDSIDASVKSTTEELRTKFNDFATIETLTQQINSVEAKILSNEATLKIINETLVNGVPVIKTATGFTFNSDGMKVDSTNAKTSTTIG